MLIDDITALKNCLGGVQKVMNWPTWQPFVKQAEMLYIIPAIGQDLHTALTGTTAPIGQRLAAKNQLEYACAFYAYTIGLPQLTTVLGDGGVSVANPAQAQPLTKWMYVELRDEITTSADKWLEMALATIDANRSLFTEFESDADTLLIPTAQVLTRYFPDARSSRRLFMAMVPYLAQAEDAISDMLGVALLADLKQKLSSTPSTINTIELEVLRLSRAALVNHAFMKAIPGLNINAEFRVVAKTDGTQNEGSLDELRRSELLRTYTLGYQTYSARLQQFLDAVANNLPLYQPPADQAKRYERPPADSSKKYYRL